MSREVIISGAPIKTSVGRSGSALEVAGSVQSLVVSTNGVSTTIAATQQVLSVNGQSSSSVVTSPTVVATSVSQGYSTGPGYVHTQSVAQAAWTVVHGLGRRPLIDVQVDGEQITARVTFPNDNSALIEFGSSQTGKALCY